MMQAGVCLRRDTETTLPELTEQHRIRQKEEELSGLESVDMAESETEYAAAGLNTLEPECVTAHSGVSDVHHTHIPLIKTETDLGSTHTGDLIKTESLDSTELGCVTYLHPDQIGTVTNDGSYPQPKHINDLQDLKVLNIKSESSDSLVSDLMNTMMSGAGVDHKGQTEQWQCAGDPNPNCKKEEINNLPTQCGDFSHCCDVHDEKNKIRIVQKRKNSTIKRAHCQRVKVVVEPMPINTIINKIPRKKGEIHTDKSLHKKCFSIKSALNKHLRNHAGDEPYKCTQCKKHFRTHSVLIIHQRIHTGEKPYKCTCCEKCFSRLCNLNRHQRIHTDEKPYKCTQCGKCFNARSYLVIHQRIHSGERPYKCIQCGKCFSTKNQLNVHQRIHTSEKPYNCIQCGKCFSQMSNLSSHLKIHTGEKPYKCTQCEKCFGKNPALIRHLRLHTGEKPYKCIQCGKCFSTKSYLEIHQRIHTGEKPFTCTQCGKCFSTICNLNIHLRIHTGEKPYKCTLCGKCFNARSYLVIHQRIHTGEKPYTCIQCGKCFSQRSHFCSHLKIHAGEKPSVCI